MCYVNNIMRRYKDSYEGIKEMWVLCKIILKIDRLLVDFCRAS